MKTSFRQSIFLAIALAALLPAGWFALSLRPSPSVTIEDAPLTPLSDEHAAIVATGTPVVSTPPPLRKPVAAAPQPSGDGISNSSALTRAGILLETNHERTANGGLPALLGNGVLDAVAVGRLEDMFAKQYFAHVGPDGNSAETVAEVSGYAYITLGENLALGNFTSDADVVTAWMGSPGHRANILNTHYTELGIAARRGTFEGRTTWIAVQVFGRPLADCPPPSADQKAAIDAGKSQLASLEADITARSAELDAMHPKRGPAYNQKVDAYNALVEQYNALVLELKSQTAAYNATVAAFNTCIGM